MMMSETIEFMKIEELKEFTSKAIELYGSEEKTREADDVANIVKELLVQKKLLDEHTHQSFVDVLMASAMIHNLFYDEEDWLTLFKARKELMPVAKEMGINEQALSAVFHTVEGQLGERTPVAECIPKPGTPTELFAYAVWFNRYMKQK